MQNDKVKNGKIIAPSTEQAKNIKEILTLENDVFACAELIHVDIMDGKFVNRKLLSKRQLSKLSKLSKMPLDFHLMCDFSKKNKDLDFYIGLKPKIISVHIEAFKNSEDLKIALKKIKDANIKVSIAVKIETDIKQILPYLDMVDMVLIMSVYVGKGGQKFNKTAFKKLEIIKAEITKKCLQVKIQIDGGVNDKNAKILFEKGADILVCGSFVFNSENRCETILQLKA